MDVTEILTISSAIIVGIFATARVTRIITVDDWPPMKWIRSKWADIVNYGDWYDLVECPWCAAPWVVAANLAFALLTDLSAAWWILNGWMAASLVASWVAIKAGE